MLSCGRAEVKASSSNEKLDPFVDSSGILRVSGRLKKIISWCHENAGHRGRGIALNHIRSCGFVIVNGSTAVKRGNFQMRILRKIAW